MTDLPPSSLEQRLTVTADIAAQHEYALPESERPANRLRNRLLSATMAGAIIAGGIVAGEYASPSEAHAQTITYGDLGYPDAAMPCEHAPYNVIGKCANYDWGATHTEKYNDPSENSGRGYGYRNCTDWVAFRVDQASGGTIDVPTGFGNAKDWYPNATSTAPKAGDVAISTSGDYGHVAFVEAVSSDGSTMTISEYNYDTKGDGDQRTLPTNNSEFTKFVDVGIQGLDGNSATTTTPTPSGPNFMPAVVQRSSGETDVAVVGPANSLDFYYNQAGSSSWGKTSVPNAAYSTPAVIQRPSGETDIAVQGPGNSMDFYYNAQGSQTWGVSHVAVPGWTYSAPAVVQRSSGETDIAVEGPNNELDFYFNTAGSPYWGKLTVAGSGSAYSAPAMIQRSSGETDIAVLRNSQVSRLFLIFMTQ
jgi:surface antigen